MTSQANNAETPFERLMRAERELAELSALRVQFKRGRALPRTSEGATEREWSQGSCSGVEFEARLREFGGSRFQNWGFSLRVCGAESSVEGFNSLRAAREALLFEVRSECFDASSN